MPRKRKRGTKRKRETEWLKKEKKKMYEGYVRSRQKGRKNTRKLKRAKV